MYTVSVTGLKPDKLYGYNLNNKKWGILFHKFQELIIARKTTNAITSMDLGVNTVFAMAVLNLRDKKHYPISLKCILPCYNMTDMWVSNIDVRRYNRILTCANDVEYVTESTYIPRCFYKRNQRIVQESDEMFAVWDGKHGEPHCVNYAKYKRLPLTILLNEEGELIE